MITTIGAAIGRRARRLRGTGRATLHCALLALPLLTLPGAPRAQAPSAATPQDIVLMLDNSGSMRANDPEFLTRVAVRAFLDGLQDGHHVAIVAFDQRVTLLMPLTRLDGTSRARFLDSLDAITYSGQLTNSPAALERSVYELRASARAEAHKSIVFMTDGIVDVAPEGPDPGDLEKARWMKSTLVDEAAGAGVRIFGIAFTDNADFELIQTLAQRTGGAYYRAYTASDIDGVFASIREQLAGTGRSASASAVAEGTPGTAATVPGPADAAATAPVTLGRESRPQAALPGTGLPRTALPQAVLPQAELPAAELPRVELPRVPLPGAAVPGATPPVPAQVSPPPPAATPGAQPLAREAARGTGGGGATTQRAPSTEVPGNAAGKTAGSIAPAQPAADGDDARLVTAMLIGALALLLALAALVVSILRRRAPAGPTAADALMPKAFLNDLGGASGQTSHELSNRPLIVGRLRGPESEAADYVVIDESTVGRRHAMIEYRDHSFWVSDQNSLNGTFVNNARIETAVRLKHGDRIRFHRHEFEFLVLDMLEADRTTMSETVFADLSRGAGDDDEDATVVRDADPTDPPSPQDPTITRH